MTPVFSFIFQIHNRAQTVKELLSPFVKAQDNGFPSEIIAVDDGSTDKTLEVIASLSTNKNFLIVHTNDIYETELCMRSIPMTRGGIIVLCQDDDWYSDMSFVTEAQRIMEKNPSIAALSCKHGNILTPDLHLSKTIGWYASTSIPISKPALNDNLQLVDTIDRAPLFIRRSAYDLIDGIDPQFLIGGYNDWDLCLRWKKAGYSVGIFHSDSFHFRRWRSGTSVASSQAESMLGANYLRLLEKHA